MGRVGWQGRWDSAGSQGTVALEDDFGLKGKPCHLMGLWGISITIIKQVIRDQMIAASSSLIALISVGCASSWNWVFWDCALLGMLQEGELPDTGRKLKCLSYYTISLSLARQRSGRSVSFIRQGYLGITSLVRWKQACFAGYVQTFTHCNSSNDLLAIT